MICKVINRFEKMQKDRKLNNEQRHTNKNIKDLVDVIKI